MTSLWPWLRRHFHPDQQWAGFAAYKWYWTLTLLGVFVSLSVSRFGSLGAADLVLGFGLTLLLLQTGYSRAALRQFVWSWLLVAVALLWFNANGMSLLSQVSWQRVMALLTLAALAMCLRQDVSLKWLNRLISSVLFIALLIFCLRWQTSWQDGVATGLIPLARQGDMLLLLVAGLIAPLLMYQKAGKDAWLLLLPAAVLALFLFISPVQPLAVQPLVRPELDHVWLKLHVPAMVVAISCLLLSGMAGMGIQISIWRGDKPETISTHRGLFYYRVMQKLLPAGLLALSVGLLSGLAWSDLVWGHYLIWEPKQIGTICLWFYYLGALHQHLQGRDRQKRLAGWLCAGLPLLLFVTFGISAGFDGRHFFP